MALTFNGSTSNYALKGLTFSASKGTLMGWCKIVTDTNDYATFFQTNNVDNSQFVVQTGVDGTTLRNYIYDASNSGTNLSVGSWNHIAVTWDGTSSRVYLNGNLDITVTATGSTWNEVRLGVSYWGEALNGCIAHLKAWDATLTAAEIAAEKNVINALRTTNLVGVWPTESGSTRLNDTSGNGNHFTAYGTITDSDNPLVANTPTLRPGWTTAQRTGNGTSISVNVPTYVTGDEIYVVYVSDGDGDVATLAQGSGGTWTAQYNNVALTGNVGVVSIWHRPATTEGSTYSITNTVSERAVAAAFAIPNFGGIDATATNSAGTTSTVTAPSLTSTRVDCLRLTIYGTFRNETAYGTFPGHTKGPEVTYASAGTISVQQKMLLASGSDSGFNFSQSASGAWLVVAFAIAPVASGTNKSVSDSATGSDATPSMSVSFGIAESASGVDSFGTRSNRFTRTDSGIGSDVLAILASLTRTDSITASELLTAQARFTLTNTWSASDTLSARVQLSRTDSATGTDAVTGMTNRFTRTDAASFTDLISQVRNLFSRSDAMTASDVIAALTAAAVVSDQASTVEGAVASAMVTLGDIFNGSDAVSIFTATLKTILEFGSFGDLLNITVAPIQVVDSNNVSEGIAISTVTAVFDSSTGTTSGITMLVSCPVADYINSVDGTQVNVTLLVPDGILTSDAVALVLDTMKQVLELAHGSDNLSVSTRTALSETLSSVDLTSVTVNLNLAETGSLSDLLLISSYFVLTDIAGLSEHVGLQVQAKVADAIQGMMVLTGISNLLEVSDLASFLDVSLAYDSATRIVTITMKLRTNRMDFEVRQHSTEFTLAQSKAEFQMAQASMEFALRQEASTFSIQGEQSDE